MKNHPTSLRLSYGLLRRVEDEASEANNLKWKTDPGKR